MPKYDLNFDPPLMNTAGSLGFAPDGHGPLDWSGLGAFVTNPVSMEGRTPARGVRYAGYPGGFLLHTGYPNSGLKRVIRHYSRQWSRSPIPVIVHLLAHEPADIEKMARLLEAVEGVSGLEVGLASDASPDLVTACTQAACGELPVLVRLPMERAVELAPGAIQAGAEAVSLAPPRGILPLKAGEPAHGRLYGPGILPMMLPVVQQLTQLGVLVIAAGGIYMQEQVNAVLSMGAIAVQLDSVLWRGAGHQILA